MNVRTELLLGYLSAEKKIDISDELKEDHPELHNMIFGTASATGRLNSKGQFNFKLTPREVARDGKDPKRMDMREEFINGYSTHLDEDEVYNKDPIPLCTYRSMSFDPKLKLASKLICGFISRLQYEIVSTDPKKAALVKYALAPIYSNLLREMSKLGMQNGFAFFEKKWERQTVKLYDQANGEQVFSGRAILPTKVKSLDPDNHFYFYIDTRTDDLVRIEQNQRGTIVSAPRKKFLWFALDSEYSNIFGMSRFRSAYQSWYFGNGLEQALLTKLDTTGEPILVVRFPPGNNMINGKQVPNDVIANEIINQVQSHKYIAMPSEKTQDGSNLWDINYVELKNSDNDAYLKAIEYFDKKKVESLGMFGNIIAGVANFSEIDAKEDLTMILIEDMVDQIENCLQTDLVDWITSYNFGPKHIPDVAIKIDRNSLGRSKMLLDLATEMMRIFSSEKTGRPKEMPDLGRILDQLNIPVASYESQISRELLDAQMSAEKKMQPKAAPLVPGAKPAQGQDAVKSKIQDEKSNDENRRTKDERDRGRPTAQERMK